MSAWSAFRRAFDYVQRLAVLDLQYRGFRDERIASFDWKHEAQFLLFGNVFRCPEEHEYLLLRQRWEVQNRPA